MSAIVCSCGTTTGIHDVECPADGFENVASRPEANAKDMHAPADAIRAGLRKCRVEDGSPVSLIREADLSHITYMVSGEVAALLARVRREGEAYGLRAAADDVWRESGVQWGRPDWIKWLRDRAGRITPRRP